MNAQLQTASAVISIAASLAAAGAVFGVFRAKVSGLEKDVNGVGKKIDAELNRLKEEFIRPLSARLTESEQDRRNMAVIMGRIEGAISSMEKRLGRIEERLYEGGGKAAGGAGI